MPEEHPEILSHPNGHLKAPETNQENGILYATRSEEVQEIMGKIPSWIIRYGIVIMTAVLAGMMVCAYFFKYPDVIPAQVTISSVSPPVKMMAKNSLPIAQLFCANNEQVPAGQVLCCFANPAVYSDVEQVTAIVKRLDTVADLRSLVRAIELPANVRLGELQSNYVSLWQAILAYRFFLEHNSYGTKIRQLSEQSGYQSQLSDALMTKDRRLKEQLSIQQDRYLIDSSLVAQTVMSRLEYEQAKKDLLNQQMNTEGNYSTILQSKVQQKEIEKSISETAIQLQTDENNLQEKIREAARLFSGSLAQWEQNYVLRSPVAGVVTFFKFWKEHQFVQGGEAVMMVTPKVQEYVARGNVGISGAGKIKPGQKVLIKLTAYPYEEFGSLSATVISRSVVAMDSTFAIDLDLTNGLHTNAGIDIPQQPQLAGMAEVITDNKSILQRLFENVYGKRRR